MSSCSSRKNETTGRDQLFKQFLREFLQEFLRLFYPRIESRLDFEPLRFLERESFTRFPEGSSREADLVAEVRTREGDRELLLVHVEVQARKRSSFAERMFQYYCLLWLSTRPRSSPSSCTCEEGAAG